MSVKNEFHSKYRPTKLKHVVGQPNAVKVLESLKGKIPHALLFTGPSGVGKTTLSRITKDLLGCSDMDYKEINAASARGVDTIREIESKMQLSPMNGKCRIFYLDEAHRLTNDAQSALLKMLEDTPHHVYFILATTDPQKLLPTIRTRCTDIALKSVEDDELRKLINRIDAKEKLDLSEAVVDALVEVADGSPRRAVVSLGRIAELETEEEQLEAIELADEKKQAIDLCRYLMGHRSNLKGWSDVALTIKSIPESDIESFRRMVLAYASSVMVGAKERKPPNKPNQKAYQVMVAFAEPFFNSGRAGLIMACCETIFGD